MGSARQWDEVLGGGSGGVGLLGQLPNRTVMAPAVLGAQHTQSLPWAGHWSPEGSVGWLQLLAGDGQGSDSSLLA